MNPVLRLDLYINAAFQMTLNALRRIGIRSTFLMMAVYVSALYFYFTFSIMSAVSNDVFGMLLGCCIASGMMLSFVRVLHEFFLVLVGQTAVVDASRLELQDSGLAHGYLWISRPGCLIGALILVVDPGIHAAMEPFSYGFLLMSLGFYLETCV